MSQENADLARSIYPTPEVDLAALVRNDDGWRGFSKAISPAFDPDVVCRIHLLGSEKRFVGLEGSQGISAGVDRSMDQRPWTGIGF